MFEPGGEPPRALVALRDALVGTDNPKAALKWLARLHNRRFLDAVVAGEADLSHAALDALEPAKSVEHLRAVLVAAGALDIRDERVARLERWIASHVAGIYDPEDRQLIDTYATWWVLRRHRLRAEQDRPAHAKQARRVIMIATELLAWLRAHSSDLDNAVQSDVDRWAMTLSVARRRGAHEFIRWANQRRITTVTIARAPATLPARDPALPDDERVVITRRLLTDDTIDVADRVAGLLVLLYAQPLTRIVNLTIDDITTTASDGCALILGAEPIALDDRVSSLVTELHAVRRGHASVAAGSDRWLFRGGRAGQHLSSERLSRRLARIGLKAGMARTNTLIDLATDTPLTVLSDLLGMHPNTASRWIQAAAGDWTLYASERVRA